MTKLSSRWRATFCRLVAQRVVVNDAQVQRAALVRLGALRTRSTTYRVLAALQAHPTPWFSPLGLMEVADAKGMAVDRTLVQLRREGCVTMAGGPCIARHQRQRLGAGPCTVTSFGSAPC